MLAVQGPRSRDALVGLLPVVTDLPYFGLAEAKLGEGPGDRVPHLATPATWGFELTVPADDAVAGPGCRPRGGPAPTGCARSARRR